MFAIKSVKRTTEKVAYAVRRSAVRYTDCVFNPDPDPSNKLLGYCHSSASRTSAAF